VSYIPFSKAAKDKALVRIEWGRMIERDAAKFIKKRIQEFRHRIGRILPDGNAAAGFGSLFRKCAHDQQAIGAQALLGYVEVRIDILVVCQEMKGGAIMPAIKFPGWSEINDV
jgi:hypothetical protein